MIRSRIAVSAALACAALALTACSSGPSVEPTGHTTTVTVVAKDMSFSPDRIEVPAGDRLVVEFENDGTQLHDFTAGTLGASELLGRGESEKLDLGVINADAEFWCSVTGHREMGMEGDIVVSDE